MPSMPGAWIRSGMQTITTNVIKDISENGDAILYWGADPETTPWGWGGQMASRLCFWFNEIGVLSMIRHGARLQLHRGRARRQVDPRAAEHRCGAAAGHRLRVDDRGHLRDASTSTRTAMGFDWFEYYVHGPRRRRAEDARMGRAERCGVPDYRIKALARYWAKHMRCPSPTATAARYIRAAFAHEPARMEVYLLGMQRRGQAGREPVPDDRMVSSSDVKTLNPHAVVQRAAVLRGRLPRLPRIGPERAVHPQDA